MQSGISAIISVNKQVAAKSIWHIPLQPVNSDVIRQLSKENSREKGRILNREELKKLADKEGIDPRMYCIDDASPYEQYVLSQEGGSWNVYYLERGTKRGMKSFDNEHDACLQLLDILRREQ